MIRGQAAKRVQVQAKFGAHTSQIFSAAALGGSAADPAAWVLAMAVPHTHEAPRGLATISLLYLSPLVLSQLPSLRLFMSNACVTTYSSGTRIDLNGARTRPRQPLCAL